MEIMTAYEAKIDVELEKNLVFSDREPYGRVIDTYTDFEINQMKNKFFDHLKPIVDGLGINGEKVSGTTNKKRKFKSNSAKP